MPKEEYDGRSLYEKLKETKDKKQEAFEEKLKFKNQFRALDDEEVAFLDDAAEEKRAIEMAKQEEIQKEMKRFKEAIACRSTETAGVSSLVAATAAEVMDKVSASTSTSKPLAAAAKVAANAQTTTMIPKKSRKAKDFQRTFLAGAIRPKSTPDQQAASATKKRKSLDTPPIPTSNNSNQPTNPPQPSTSTDAAPSEACPPKLDDNPPCPKKPKTKS